jgi:hypothetical protein
LQRTPQTNLNGPYETIRITKARHSDRIKSISRYCSNNSDNPNSEGDWSRIIHGELEELRPNDNPEPLGSFVTSTQYLDSNLKHQVLLANIEKAAYGSVFVAAWNCVKQIIDLPNMPRYLGDPIHDKSHMFGDDNSVVDSSMQVNAKLHKGHTILSIHQLIPKWLDSISSQEITTLLNFKASTGDILKLGKDSSHYYIGWDTQLIFMIEELHYFE